MSEFNPNKKDLLNIESLILDIKNKKNDLVNRKMQMENSISNMHDKKKKQSIKKVLHEVELSIKAANEELNYKNKLRLEVEHHIKHNHTRDRSTETEETINKLNALKKKYADFTKDRTRIASLRVMASEFITELETIIRTL